MTTHRTWNRWRGGASLAAAIAAAAMAGAGCAVSPHDGSSSSYLVVSSLLGAGGATPGALSGVLASDVLSMVNQTVNGQQVTVPTALEDVAQVSLQLELRDPGTSTAPTAPTARNFVTITQYQVSYSKADGTGTPGVDVPLPFASAITVTVTDAPAAASLVLVQASAKTQAPLVGLVGTLTELATVAHVTFSGVDQSGRAVSATASIGVNFADWGG